MKRKEEKHMNLEGMEHETCEETIGRQAVIEWEGSHVKGIWIQR